IHTEVTDDAVNEGRLREMHRTLHAIPLDVDADTEFCVAEIGDLPLSPKFVFE
ncbi:hypothetical protein FOMPIDRAFT_1088686, partial [Fomitopsis schrenkii]